MGLAHSRLMPFQINALIAGLEGNDYGILLEPYGLAARINFYDLKSGIFGQR
jgi:hypothetical protein